MLFLYYATTAYSSQADSLLHVLAEVKTTNNQSKLYDIHFQLAEAYTSSNIEDYEKGIQHFTQAFQIAHKMGDIEKSSYSLYGLGNSNQRRNNFQEALKYYTLLLDLDEDPIKNPQKGNAFSQISAIHQTLGNYEKAYENQMQALLIYEVKNDSVGLANGQYNIGTIFFYQNQFEQSLEHYEKAKVICDAINNERFIYSCLAALGSVNEKLDNNEKSLEYNIRSLRLAEKLNYKTGIAYAKGNVAANYRGQGDYQKAEKFLKEAISIKSELADKWGTIGSNIDLSKLYLIWEKPQEAIPLLEETLVLSKEVDSKSRIPDIYQLLASVYEQTNDTEKAFLYTKKYIATKDSLISEKTVEEMGQSKRRFELAKHEHEIALLKKENVIQKQQSYIFAIALLAFLMFLWWYKSKLKYQNRMNRLLEEKNEILNQKNDEIRISNKQLEHSNEDLQQFAYVASHDLKEPLRMINSYTTLLERRYNDLYDDTGKEFMHYIVDAVKRMETLLDDLLNFSRVDTRVQPEEFVSTASTMVYVEANLRHRLQTLNATLIVKEETLPSIKAHKTQLLQLLQNLVSNGVKFKGERDPVVVVDCVKETDRYVISVKDNGIGITKENLEKVFEMFRRLHSRDEYEGTGIGLATCKRIVSNWGGDIWVDSVYGEGSTFSFSVPLTVAQPPVAAFNKVMTT